MFYYIQLSRFIVQYNHHIILQGTTQMSPERQNLEFKYLTACLIQILLYKCFLISFFKNFKLHSQHFPSFLFLASARLNFINIIGLFRSYLPKHLKLRILLVLIYWFSSYIHSYYCFICCWFAAFSLYCVFNLFIFFPQYTFISLCKISRSAASALINNCD